LLTLRREDRLAGTVALPIVIADLSDRIPLRSWHVVSWRISHVRSLAIPGLVVEASTLFFDNKIARPIATTKTDILRFYTTVIILLYKRHARIFSLVITLKVAIEAHLSVSRCVEQVL